MPDSDPVLDADEDGVPEADDCDDSDASVGAIANDADCDGIPTYEDCDDDDPDSNAIKNDLDCDGLSSAEDCADLDPLRPAPDDLDCDGVPTPEDCDDTNEWIFPGAAEVPGNSIDENCDDRDTAQFTVNEILAYPGTAQADYPGAGSDANFDGESDPREDQFIEFVNVSLFPVDVSGFRFDNAETVGQLTPVHRVPDSTILRPGGALVVFGGGTPGIDRFGDPTNGFGGAVVQTATSGELDLGSGSRTVSVQNIAGNFVGYVDVPWVFGESSTRSPDITGQFVPHTEVVDGVRFTPGTRTSNVPF